MAPSKGRPRCFFDVSIGDVSAGRIIFELFSDVCPLTTENFRLLCTGEKGVGEVTGKPLHYRGTKIHRVVKDFIIQGGDFSAGNGTGGESIYGGTFADENFDMMHDKPFLLSMANRGKDTNGSQFFLTTKPAPHLDGLHVVFGHVIDGEDVVTKIETQRTDAKSRPMVEVTITNCGELVLQVKPKEPKKRKKKLVSTSSSSDSDSSSSTVSESSALTPSSQVDTESTDSEEERRRKRKKKKKLRMKIRRKRQRERRKLKKKQKLEQETGNGEGKPLQSEIAPNVTINPEEIPDIPRHNFLTRVPMEKKEGETGGSQGDSQHRPLMSRSGRKVKGRGSVRYRTPTRSHSGSPTPQYWKSEANRQVELQRGWDIDATRRYITTGKTTEDEKWEKGSALKEQKYKSRHRDRDRYDKREKHDYSSPEDSRSWRNERRDSRYERRDSRNDDEFEDDYYYEEEEQSHSERKKKKKDKEKTKEKKSSKKKRQSHQKSDDPEPTPTKLNGNGEKEHRAENAEDDSPPPSHWKQGQKPWKAPDVKGKLNDLYKDLVPPSKKLPHPADIFNDSQEKESSSDEDSPSLKSLSETRRRLQKKMKSLDREKQKEVGWQPPEEDESIETTTVATALGEVKESPGTNLGARKAGSYQERNEVKTSPPQDRKGSAATTAKSEEKGSPEGKVPTDVGHLKAAVDTPASPTSDDPEEGVFAGAPVVPPPARKTMSIVIEKSRWELDDEPSPVEKPPSAPPKEKEPPKFKPLKPAEPVPAAKPPVIKKSVEVTSLAAPPAKVPVTKPLVAAKVAPPNPNPPRVVTVVDESPVVVVPDSSGPAKVPQRKAMMTKISLGNEIKKKGRRLRKRKSWTRSPSGSPGRSSVSRSRSRSHSPEYRRESRREHRSRHHRRHSQSSRSRSRSYSRSRSRSHHRGRSRSRERDDSRSPRRRSRSRSHRSRSYSSRSRSSRSRSYSRSRSRSYSRR